MWRRIVCGVCALVLTSVVIITAKAAGYVQVNLVANHEKYHPTAFVDPDLVSPWGMAVRPPGARGHIWTSNAGTGTTTTYIGDIPETLLYQDGLKVVPIVTSARDMLPVGGSDGNSDQIAQVTGQVYNAASDLSGQPVEFPVSGPAINYSDGKDAGIDSGSAKFVFVTQDGTINAWRAKTDPGMLEAVVIKDFSLLKAGGAGWQDTWRATPGFNGVAMTVAPAVDQGGTLVADNRVYVADFANGNIWSSTISGTRSRNPACSRGRQT